MNDPELVRIDAGGWGATYCADRDGRLRQLGLGPNGHRAEVAAPPHLYPDAHPCWGASDPFREAALRITHHDGTLTTRLRVERSVVESLEGGAHTRIECRDELFALVVTHHFRTHPDSGVVEQWVEVTNSEPGPVTLHDYDSVAPLLLVTPRARVAHFGGSGWADEWRWTSQEIHPGNLSLGSLGGLQPHLQRAPFLLLDPGDRTTIAMSIGWGGNTRFELDLRPRADPGAPGELRIRAGANPYAAHYVLDPGETFASAPVAWTWAPSRAEATERMHHWIRSQVLRDPERLRAVVLNNWEATGMDFDEDRVVALIESTAELGAELFLLDDGWFSPNHPRDDDTRGLGDWDPDPAKLPGGFAPLVEAAERVGVRFGTWVEPEMVNPDSDLFGQHPDWVVRDRREPREHRQQLALDPLRVDVRHFELGVFDSVLGTTPGISYLKWDANRPVTEVGSTTLAADRQSNAWVDHVRSTWELMDDVVERHPDVELMLCASGGGRVDHGSLSRFHEVWPSDNTDPVARVRMQWAFSHFLPASVMASHVTRWGERPLAFACAVALSGRFGFDLDPGVLSEEELATCRRAVAIAKRIAPVVQQGRIEHLVSPVEGRDRSRAALAYHAPHGSHSVLFTYQLEEPESPPPAVQVGGLDPATGYEVSSSDLLGEPEVHGTLTGERLATEGVPWQPDTPCTARIWEFRLRS